MATTSTSTSTVVAIAEPLFTSQERLVLADVGRHRPGGQQQVSEAKQPNAAVITGSTAITTNQLVPGVTAHRQGTPQRRSLLLQRVPAGIWPQPSVRHRLAGALRAFHS
jgi:hypothetical protein